MTVSMAHFIAISIIALLLGTAVLQLMGKRRLSCWLLGLLPASLCAACLFDIASGAAKIGEGAYESDQKQLLCCLLFLLLTLVAALRPQWNWLFWIAWAFGAILCGILVYLAFFWKVFS